MRSIALVLAVLVSAAAQETPKWKSTKPINDLPNPYTRDAGWAKLPAGMPWGAVIGAEQGPDGNMFVVHRCFENSCAGRTEPPIFKFDRTGKVLKSWGVGTFVFPHGFYVDERGHVWVSDAQRRDGKGHQDVRAGSRKVLLAEFHLSRRGKV